MPKILNSQPPLVLTPSDSIFFMANSSGVIQIHIGEMKADLTFDVAQDFLFELAGFIASVEKRQQKGFPALNLPGNLDHLDLGGQPVKALDS